MNPEQAAALLQVFRNFNSSSIYYKLALLSCPVDQIHRRPPDFLQRPERARGENPRPHSGSCCPETQKKTFERPRTSTGWSPSLTIGTATAVHCCQLLAICCPNGRVPVARCFYQYQYHSGRSLWLCRRPISPCAQNQHCLGLGKGAAGVPYPG
jgi:hypothetical protein